MSKKSDFTVPPDAETCPINHLVRFPWLKPEARDILPRQGRRRICLQKAHAPLGLFASNERRAASAENLQHSLARLRRTPYCSDRQFYRLFRQMDSVVAMQFLNVYIGFCNFLTTPLTFNLIVSMLSSPSSSTTFTAIVCTPALN